MISDARREALVALARLSDLAPDVRIGQLMAHLGVLSEDEGRHGLGDIENAELLAVIQRHHEELAHLTPTAPNQPLQTGAA
jgi:hypothetical protein